MYQIEELDNYLYNQVNDVENQEFPEEQREENNFEEEEGNQRIGNQQKEIKIFELRSDDSNRLNSEPKKYKTYTMEYKKKLIQEVIKNNLIN